MAKTELSLQALYNMIKEKTDKNHSHKFIGTISDALKLAGVAYDKFMRNDLKDQVIKSNQNTVSVSLESNNSQIKAVAGNNKNYLVFENKNLDTNNLTISGYNNEDVIINVKGDILINGVSITGLEPRVPASTDTTPQTLENPVGTIIQMISHSVPTGYIEANGDELLRDRYPTLFNFAYTQTDILSEDMWQEQAQSGNVGFYSKGDELITFRVPLLNGEDNIRYFIKY